MALLWHMQLQARFPGLHLQIIATDPGSVEDMAALARQTGHELLESRQESDKYYFLMKKG